MKKIILIGVAFILFRGAGAEASIMKIDPVRTKVNAGDTITLNLSIDTELESINAAEAEITFPSSILEFVSANRAGSPFSYWVEEPNAKDGTIHFLSGSTEGISDRSVKLFTFVLKAKKDGVAPISVTNGVVTANDGEGTNVLRASQDAEITIGAGIKAVLAEEPKKVTRAPEEASKLPRAPVLRVPFYPDATGWNNQVSDFSVFWDLPADVSAVAAVVDQSPNTEPSAFGDSLFTGKKFKSLQEGVWYVHVRYKNNIGDGPTAHYRIAVDITEPSAFKISADGAKEASNGEIQLSTDNPQPILRFSSRDSLSGIAYYGVNVGNALEVRTDNRQFKLPILGPGENDVTVTAIDRAGNSRSSSIKIVVTPIEAPVITSVEKDVYVGEGDLSVHGTARPGFQVIVSVHQLTGELAGKAHVATDAKGNWDAVIKEPLKLQRYYVEAVSQDNRGARSLPVKSASFKVKTKPLLVLFGLPITPAFFYIGIISILTASFGFGFLSYRLWRGKLSQRSMLAGRDVVNIADNLEKDIENITQKLSDSQIPDDNRATVDFALKQMKERIAKTKKYVAEDIRDLPR